MTRQTGNLSTGERTVSALLGLALSLFGLRRANPIARIVVGVSQI